MAADLSLAAPSIETHLHNIFRKLNATNRGEAVSSALKVGLITLADAESGGNLLAEANNVFQDVYKAYVPASMTTRAP